MGLGYSLTAFAGTIGVCRDTLHEWTREHPEFSDAVKVAKAKRTFTLETKLLNGEIGPHVTAAIFALKNAAPEEWREKHEIVTTNTTKVEHSIDYSGLSTDELAALVTIAEKAAQPDQSDGRSEGIGAAVPELFHKPSVARH